MGTPPTTKPIVESVYDASGFYFIGHYGNQGTYKQDPNNAANWILQVPPDSNAIAAAQASFAAFVQAQGITPSFT